MAKRSRLFVKGKRAPDLAIQGLAKWPQFGIVILMGLRRYLQDLLAKYPRTGYALISLSCFIWAAYAWFTTVRHAQRHEPTIVMFTYGIIFTVSFGCLAALSVVAPGKMLKFAGDLGRRKRTFRDYFFIFLMILPGLIAYWILDYKIGAFGYR